jgi:hypothetical protein
MENQTQDNSANANDILVQCTRCKNQHQKSERISKSGNHGMYDLICPRCNCKSYYDMSPMVAWCYASGLIEIGDPDSIPEGALKIAHGPKSFLYGQISVVARHGKGGSGNQLLVPGVPEADSQAEKMDALEVFLHWCEKRNGKKSSKGVVFCRS